MFRARFRVVFRARFRVVFRARFRVVFRAWFRVVFQAGSQVDAFRDATGDTAGETQITISRAETEVTVAEIRPSIVSVRHWTEHGAGKLLTKRRAVDFCRVAASLCRMA